MAAKKKLTKPKQKIGSDLSRLDALGDDDIDYSDAPVPDLADWVRHARDFSGPPAKASVTMRLDADVVDFFKQDGRGYQTRVNRVLRAYVDSQRRSQTVRRRKTASER